VLFGDSGPLTDILVNNIAWVVRHMPIFGLFGDGRYRLRPLHVDDMARLMLHHADLAGNTEADAVGPETFTFRELVESLASIIGVRRTVVSLPPWVGLVVGKVMNPFLGDVIITREEVKGLMRGLLDSPALSPGVIALTDWARERRTTIGTRYASEVGRRVR
jgi:NADH dehydrogenase